MLITAISAISINFIIVCEFAHFMFLKLVQHKVVDDEPFFLPSPRLDGVTEQVATDLRVLVTCLHLS